MLQLHRSERELDAHSCYWVCTFANRQHNLSDLAGGIMDTPFVKCLNSEACVGTILVLDGNCTPFSRVWCILELHVSARENAKEHHLYDLAAWCPKAGCLYERAALQLQLSEETFSDRMEFDDGEFPEHVADVGAYVDVRAAQASRPTDKKAIMDHISGQEDSLNSFVASRFINAALRWSAGQGDTVKVAALIDRGADVQARAADGQSPSSKAAEKGMVECLKVLIEARANVDASDTDGRSPVYKAVTEGNIECLKVLVEASADVNAARTFDGNTPAHQAARRDDVDCLKVLAEAGADLSRKNKEGETPRDLALQFGKFDAEDFLDEATAGVNK